MFEIVHWQTCLKKIEKVYANKKVNADLTATKPNKPICIHKIFSFSFSFCIDISNMDMLLFLLPIFMYSLRPGILDPF